MFFFQGYSSLLADSLSSVSIIVFTFALFKTDSKLTWLNKFGWSVLLMEMFVASVNFLILFECTADSGYGVGGMEAEAPELLTDSLICFWTLNFPVIFWTISCILWILGPKHTVTSSKGSKIFFTSRPRNAAERVAKSNNNSVKSCSFFLFGHRPWAHTRGQILFSSGKLRLTDEYC